MLRWFVVTAVLLAQIGLFPTAALTQTASIVLRELTITPEGEQFRSFAGIPQTFIPDEDRNFVVNPPTDFRNRSAKVTAVIDYTFSLGRETESGAIFACRFTVPEFPNQPGTNFVIRVDEGQSSGNATGFIGVGEMLLAEGIEREYTFSCRIVDPAVNTGAFPAEQQIVIRQTYEPIDTIRILSVDPPPTEPLAPETPQTFVATVEYTRDVIRLGSQVMLVALDGFGNELIPRTDRRQNNSAQTATGDGPNPVEIDLTLRDVPIPLDGIVQLHAEQVNQRQFGDWEAASYSTYNTSDRVIYGEPPGTDFSIWHIEAIQVVQDDDNLISLVADKRTLLRVYVRTPVLPDQREAEALTVLSLDVVMRNAGAEHRVATRVLALNAQMGEKPSAIRHLRVAAAEIPVPLSLLSPGTLEVEATVNLEGGEPVEPEAGVENNTFVQEFTLHERDTLAIGYVDLGTDLATYATGFLKKVFPVSPKRGFAYIPLDVPNNPNATGQSILLEAAAAAAGGLVDVLVVWYDSFELAVPKKLLSSLSNGRLILIEEGEVINIVVPRNNQKFFAALVAKHFLRGEARSGAPSHELIGDCTSADDADFNAVGWDFDSSLLLNLARQRDLVTDCAIGINPSVWISPSRYARLFLRDFTFFPPTAGVKEEIPTKLQSMGDLMIIAGDVHQDGSATLAPSVKLTGLMGDELSSQGQYCLDLFGGGVNGLRHCFTPDFSEVSTLPFAFIFPYDAGLSGVSLSRDGTEIASLDASPGAPAVAVTVPAAGTQLDAARPVTISWTASDPDGDGLVASVFYSFDGGAAWLPLRTGIAGESMTFDASTIHGGDNVHFRVSVSDGLRSAESSVGPLTLLQRPKVSVPQTTDAGESAVGISRPVSISVEASGTGVLRIEVISSDDSAFVPASSLPIQLVAGTTGDIQVNFTPATPGNHQANLTLTTNAPGNETVQVHYYPVESRIESAS